MKRDWKMQPSSTPALSQASIMASQRSSVISSGLSHRTWTFRSAQARVGSRWKPDGVQTSATSGCSVSSISS